MSENQSEPKRPVSDGQHRPPVPDVWFSSPPEEEPLDEKPNSSTGMRILFSSPALSPANRQA